MNYYSHHIGDYLLDTAHLSILEDGVYRRLIDRYYTTEKPLQKDETTLFRVVRARTKEEKDSVRTILAEFFLETSEGWSHKRCDEEIAIYHEKAEKNRVNGAKGGRPPKSSITQVVTPETQVVSETNPEITLTKNQEPITNITTPKPPIGGLVPATRKKSAIALNTFLEECKQRGERPLRDYAPLWAYTEAAGMDRDMVALAWIEFCRRFMPGGVQPEKRQKDWRITFRKYVENNYFKLWAIDKDGKYFLTTQGKQSEKFHETKESA